MVIHTNSSLRLHFPRTFPGWSGLGFGCEGIIYTRHDLFLFNQGTYNHRTLNPTPLASPNLAMVGAMPTMVAKHAYNVGHYCNLVLTQWVVARLLWLQNTHTSIMYSTGLRSKCVSHHFVTASTKWLIFHSTSSLHLHFPRNFREWSGLGFGLTPKTLCCCCSHINSWLQCSPWSQDRLQQLWSGRLPQEENKSYTSNL